MRTENAIQYTIQALFNIALGRVASFNIQKCEQETVVVEIEKKIIVFHICNNEDFEKLLNGELKLSDVRSFDDQFEIPAVFGNSQELFTCKDSVLNCNFDILSLSFILLSNLDEYLSKKKDEHDRFLYTDSICYKYNLTKIPLVDEYAMLLRNAIQKYFPEIKITPRKSSVITTHDIDQLFRFSGIVRSIQTIGSQFFHTQNLKECSTAFLSFVKSISNKKNDHYYSAIFELIQQTLKFGHQGVFFFMSAPKTQYDEGQDIKDAALEVAFQDLRKYGMTIGIHPGYYTYQNLSEMKRQKKYLEEAIGTPITHSRQHYLRFDRKKTIQNLVDAGIQYDYTLGFAEEEGFRCGTAHPYHLYDFENDCKYPIIEKPLIVMDVTLQLYKKYSIKNASQTLMDLYYKIKRTEGDFIILWHNAYVYRDVEYYREVYLNFLKQTAS